MSISLLIILCFSSFTFATNENETNYLYTNDSGELIESDDYEFDDDFNFDDNEDWGLDEDDLKFEQSELNNLSSIIYISCTILSSPTISYYLYSSLYLI